VVRCSKSVRLSTLPMPGGSVMWPTAQRPRPRSRLLYLLGQRPSRPSRCSRQSTESLCLCSWWQRTAQPLASRRSRALALRNGSHRTSESSSATQNCDCAHRPREQMREPKARARPSKPASSSCCSSPGRDWQLDDVAMRPIRPSRVYATRAGLQTNSATRIASRCR